MAGPIKAAIHGYDYMSGEYRAIYVDASGEIKIVATVVDIVTAKVSGQTVTVASGPYVLVSGQMVQVASGARVLVSGQMVQVASGAFVLISGQQVVAKVSGETVDIKSPTAIKTGAIIKATAASGGTIVTSGAVKSATFKPLSGDVYLGGAVAGQMPYSGFGFLLTTGEAWSFDIDNFGRARICANISGAFVTYGGIA